MRNEIWLNTILISNYDKKKRKKKAFYNNKEK